jgi:hypothetical protein
VEPILVDCRQLGPERFVEQLDDLGVALHAVLLSPWPLTHEAAVWKQKNGGFLRKICD